MSHIRSICVTKKSSVMGSFPSSTGWLGSASCIFLGLPNYFSPLAGRCSQTEKEWLGLGRSHRRVSEKASRDWQCKAARRVSWAPRKEAILPGEGDSCGWVVVNILCWLSKGISSLDPWRRIFLSMKKGNKKSIYFPVLWEVVLKQKSICLTKFTFLL